MTQKMARPKTDAAPEQKTRPRATPGSSAARAYQLHAQIGYKLRRANQIAVELFSEVIDPVFGPGVITTAQFAVLSSAWEFPGANQSELANYVSMDMPTLNGVLKRLQARDLIRVEVEAGDKRRRAIVLTPAGRELAERLRATGEEVSRRILAPLGEESRAAFSQLLQQFIAAHRPK